MDYGPRKEKRMSRIVLTTDRFIFYDDGSVEKKSKVFDIFKSAPKEKRYTLELSGYKKKIVPEIVDVPLSAACLNNDDIWDDITKMLSPFGDRFSYEKNISLTEAEYAGVQKIFSILNELAMDSYLSGFRSRSK